MSAFESGSETETSEKPESETELGSEEEEDLDSGNQQPKGNEKSEEDEDEHSEEEEDGNEEPEKQEVRPTRPKLTVQPMPNLAPVGPKKTALGPSVPAAASTANKVNHPPYPVMVLDAMHVLITDERRISGVSFAKVAKFISEKIEAVNEKNVKLYCWKAVEKHIKDEILMKKTGIGMQGSIGYSAKYRTKLKKAANPKSPKAAKPKAAPKKEEKKAAPAAKAEPKKKPATKAKPAKKDSNNNSKTAKPTKKAATAAAAGIKKAVVSKTTGKVRLSVAGPAMASKPKKTAAKAKPAAGAKKVEAAKKPAAGAKTKAPAPEVAGPSKKAKKLMF